MNYIETREDMTKHYKTYENLKLLLQNITVNTIDKQYN